MPTMKSIQEVGLEVQGMIEKGEILLGSSIESDDLTDAIVDGQLVKKELVATVHARDPEDLTTVQLQEAFPGKRILKMGASVHVVCPTREEVLQLCKTTPMAGEQELALTPFKGVTVKAQFSRLSDVIWKILVDELPACTFVPGLLSFLFFFSFFFFFFFFFFSLSLFPNLNLILLRTGLNVYSFIPGQVYKLKLLLWADAKYTYREKSFIKVALMGAPFPKHRSKIYRWGDLYGHEVELLDRRLVAPILVPLLSFFFSCDRVD